MASSNLARCLEEFLPTEVPKYFRCVAQTTRNCGSLRECRSEYSAYKLKGCCGGPGRVRTVDLFHAMEARSQLRHRPIFTADRQPRIEKLDLGWDTRSEALQGHWSVTEYSTSGSRGASELTVWFTHCLQ